MARITRVEVFQVDLKPQVQRGDAIQSFHTQETPMVRLYDDSGPEGTGLFLHHRQWRRDMPIHMTPRAWA